MASAKETEPQDKDGFLPGLDRYLRRMYQASWFPQLDRNGRVYVKTKVGTKMVNRILSQSELNNHLNLYFREGVHLATNPRYRARFHCIKRRKFQNYFTGRSNQASEMETIWDDIALKKVASEFC